MMMTTIKDRGNVDDIDRLAVARTISFFIEVIGH
jgi:hypothetical protein